MIATAALADRLLAEADFSRSGRRKMVGSVLDDGGDCNARRSHLLAKAGLRSERALRRKVSGIIRSVVREIKFFYRLNSRARPVSAAVNLLIGIKFIV